MRVLHLLDPAYCGDEGVLACARAMTIPGIEHSCWIIGSERDERRAWSMGIGTADRVQPRRWLMNPPFAGAPNMVGAAKRVRALAAARFGASETTPDIVCCWSVHGLALARRVFGVRQPRRVGVLVRTPVECVDGGPVRSIAEYGLHDATAVTLGSEIADAYARAASVRRGGRLLRDNIREIEPPVLHAGDIAARRQEARERIGVSADECVIGLLGDPARAGDATRFIFNIGLAYTMGERLVGLASRDTRYGRRAARFVRAHGRRWGFRLADLGMAEIAAASDVCVIDRPRLPDGRDVPTAGLTACSLCAALGVPVVAMPGALEASPARSAPPPPAAMAPGIERNKLVVPIARLLEDAGARAEFAAAQRDWCAAAAGRDGFRRTLGDIFREQANVPVERPGLPRPTALAGSAG